MRCLSVDPGETRIGLAVGGDIGELAFPLGNLTVQSLAQAAADISRHAREEDAAVIVIGLPLRADGSEGVAAARSRALGAALEARMNSGHTCAIRYMDERMSSAAADRRLAEAGFKGRKAKQRRDIGAAVHILQTYLRQHRNASLGEA